MINLNAQNFNEIVQVPRWRCNFLMLFFACLILLLKFSFYNARHTFFTNLFHKAPHVREYNMLNYTYLLSFAFSLLSVDVVLEPIKNLSLPSRKLMAQGFVYQCSKVHWPLGYLGAPSSRCPIWLNCALQWKYISYIFTMKLGSKCNLLPRLWK